MLDLHEARIWADNPGALNRSITDLLADVRTAFDVLARIRYDQPWNRAPACRSDKI